ncbi:MAG: hypothetical protein RLZZ241_1416 [Bacteroidota bacterium]
MHVVIVGNGISGITAARHIRKRSSCRISIISEESDYFFSRTALMYIYMGHMTFEHTKPYEDSFWTQNRIELRRGRVTELDAKSHKIVMQTGETLAYDRLILATGSQPKFFDWPGLHLKGVQGLYSIQDLAKLETHAPNAKVCPHAVIVGGGLIGIEVAEMLLSRNIAVTFLVREAAFWNTVLPNCDAQILNQHIKDHTIDLRLNTTLEAVLGDSENRVRGVRTAAGLEIDCNLVVICTGVTPNVAFLESSSLEIDRGILVNSFLETNISNIYALGDCAQLRNPSMGRNSIEAVWYTGRIMGETVAKTLCGNPTTYQPGNWFNSAKFLDIEYQTYGQVSSDATRPPEAKLFHWKHPKFMIWLTLSYHESTRKMLGINAFGMRLRHLVLDHWISQGATADFVISRLNEALFDPELTQNHIPRIQQSFLKNLNNAP